MLDLFNVNKSPEQAISDLKQELFEFTKTQGYKIRKPKPILYGDLDNVGKACLIVGDIPDGKLFESKEDKLLYSLAESYHLRYFYTYSYLLPNTKVPKLEVRHFSSWIQRLTSIIKPVLIICLGEISQLSYFSRKFLLKDFHGKEIGKFEDIPVYTTYDIKYYMNESKIEDEFYKIKIKNNDWNNIKTKYKELTCL